MESKYLLFNDLDTKLQQNVILELHRSDFAPILYLKSRIRVLKHSIDINTNFLNV